jgi:hypothetical protein
MQEHLEPEDVFDPDYYKRVKLKADERAKIKLQNECEHIYFVCRCSKCNKVLGGEKHFKKIC